jgi:hypothetical protein
MAISRSRRLALALAIVMSGASCRNEITSADVTPYAGTYTLLSVNNFPLPYAILQSPDVRLEITDESFALATNSSFLDVTHYRRTTGVGIIDYPTDTLTGTFTVRGQTIEFTTANGALFAGTIGLTSFSVVGNATIFRYSK